MKEQESFDYLKKQIKKEIKRYNESVTTHGFDRVSQTLHIQIHLDEGKDILNFPSNGLEYTEEDLRRAFYDGREQKSLPNHDPQFIRPTFQGYLRELDGKEDPHKNWEKRLVEYYDEVDPVAFDRIRDIIVDRYGCDPLEVVDDAHLKDDLGLDSLDIVELTMEMEKEFALHIEDETTEEMNNWCVEQVVNYILSKTKK